MIPTMLLQIAWVLIVARCGYMAIQLINKSNKPWFEILYFISVVIVALSFLF